MGNLTAQTDPLGRTTNFVYNDHGQRTQRRLPDDTTASPHRESTAYDAAGRVLTTQDFKGQTTAYRYDALNRRIETIDNRHREHRVEIFGIPVFVASRQDARV